MDISWTNKLSIGIITTIIDDYPIITPLKNPFNQGSSNKGHGELGNWWPGFNPSDQRQLEASKNGPGLANVYKKHGKSWDL